MSSKLIKCPVCKGSGKIIEEFRHMQFPAKCETCKGTGKVKK